MDKVQERYIINSAPPPKRHPYSQWSPDARALDLVGDKWTLLIVRDLVAGPRRFVELQRVLPGISTEQLRSRLNRMVADGLLTRQRYREVPPRVDYELTERARDLVPVLAALARWGYAWAWGAPRRGEEIDVGAILRLAPGLLSPPAQLHGTAALTVTGRSKGDAERTYVLTATDGRVELAERQESGEADARAVGSEEAWIAALGPDAAREGLELTGDRALVDALLEGLSSGRSRLTAVA
jgi:DNA-binding HxlR family transcriptional regulator